MDNQAFWLGAEVGHTESISHVPTQITNYKSSATPLSDKELSFFKGYLLRSGATAKKYSVYIKPTVKIKFVPTNDGTTIITRPHYQQVVKWTNKWAYLQNASIATNSIGFGEICYIILNFKKQKIDAEGNEVLANDKTYYRTPTTLSLAAGTYYYREISNSCSKLLINDYKFTVSETSDYQTVEISHMPKLVKMEYHADYEIGDNCLSVLQNCINTTTQHLEDNYYDPHYGKSLSVSLTMPRTIRIDHTIDNILVECSDFDTDLTDKFQISWSNACHTYGLLDTYFAPDKIMSFGDEVSARKVYLDEGKFASRDTYKLYGYAGMDKTLVQNVQLPCCLMCECAEANANTSLNIKRYYPLNGVEYSCQYEVNDLAQISDGYGEAYHGYVEEVRKIWGSLYQKRVTGYSVQLWKNIHPQINVIHRQSSTLAESKVSTYNYWDTSGNSHVETTSKEAVVTDNDYAQTFESSVTSPITGYAEVYRFVYNSCRTILSQNGIDLKPTLGGMLWYYETDDGICEASDTGTKRCDYTENPTIEDESKITKAFIAAPIFYNEIKEGYENYFE